MNCSHESAITHTHTHGDSRPGGLGAQHVAAGAGVEECAEPEDDDGLPDPLGFSGASDGGGSSGDELYDQAVAIVAREGKASTSFIQRHLKIGYNRAATLIERMEAEGVVGQANHVGKREVLIGDHSA